MLTDIAFLVADTMRSRVYAQAMIKSGLTPTHAIILENNTGKGLPGQTAGAVNTLSPINPERPHWQNQEYDLNEPLLETLKKGNISIIFANNHDVNSEETIKLIAAQKESVFIYSGYGGVLLKKPLLACGKNFLHVHGGYLPDFKGSTTNYYSLLAENTIGASSIFLTAEIDCGPILLRKKFSAPNDRTKIDSLYDSAARAEVLKETLMAYEKNKKWEFALPENKGGETYYIIHPVLKHLAVLAGE